MKRFRDFIERTANDTIEFFKVPIRFLEDIRDKTLSPERAKRSSRCY